MKKLQTPKLSLKNLLKTPSKKQQNDPTKKSKMTFKKMSRKKKLLIIGIFLLIIVAAAVGFSRFSKKNRMKNNMAEAFTTETATITRQTLSNSISATGTVESAKTKTVNTKLSNIEVTAVHVAEGDYVEEGDIICEFDSSDYKEALAKAQNNYSVNQKIDALGDDYTTIYEETIANAEEGLADVRETRDDAKESYLEAMDDLADAESDADSAKNTYEAYVKQHPNAEADYHNAKAALEKVQNASNAVNEAKNALETANTALANAKKDLENAKASEEELDLTDFQKAVYDAEHTVETASSELTKAESAFAQLNTTVDAASAAFKEAERIYNKLQGYKSAYQQKEAAVASAEQSTEQSKAQYEQAQSQRENYQDQYDSAVKKAQEDYDRAVLEEQLITESQEEKTIDEYTELIEDCVVRATMSGVITSLNVTEGNVFEGGNIYTIQDNENFIVTSSVDEYDISSIEKGMSAYIKTDATGDAEMNGEVTYVAISSSGNGAMGAISSSGSYTIKVSVSNPDEKLRAGMTAKISISLEEAENVLTVPYDAVTTSPDGTSSITIDENGEKKTITVKTGLETDYYTEIISNEISEGMTVYLSTPLITSTPSNFDPDDTSIMDGLFNGGGMPDGGNMPGGGSMPGGGGNSGGGMPGGGGNPGGGPGGF